MIEADEISNDGIAQRFQMVWEEIEHDIKSSGGVM
jgi:hypothetical protein